MYDASIIRDCSENITARGVETFGFALAKSGCHLHLRFFFRNLGTSSPKKVNFLGTPTPPIIFLKLLHVSYELIISDILDF